MSKALEALIINGSKVQLAIKFTDAVDNCLRSRLLLPQLWIKGSEFKIESMDKHLGFFLVLLMALPSCSQLSGLRGADARKNDKHQQMLLSLKQQRSEIEKLREQNTIMRIQLQRNKQARREKASEDAAASFQRAQRLHQSNLHAQALKEVNQFLKDHPKHPMGSQALVLKANILEALKVPELAQSVWRQILTEHPKSKAAQRAEQVLQQAKMDKQ